MGRGQSLQAATRRVKSREVVDPKQALAHALKKELEAQARRSQEAASQTQTNLEKFAQGFDPDKQFFTVWINDVWDMSRDVNRRGSGKTTGRGLEKTVLEAEREYQRRCGDKARDDGVLEYSVYAHVGETTVNIPKRIWFPYTATGRKAASKKKGKGK